ncbi:hypothetical protein PoB_001002800 [Plakobranchus ocellatus]|uniref:Uncharacterized protein n=1 Tax=Plakobranchus ocellatus TaxID=259542 RepID=A0AAV3YLV3_9GAST|nr:hypothetical protein PoB_001002800 [Plakobranchus ocellatus]
MIPQVRYFSDACTDGFWWPRIGEPTLRSAGTLLSPVRAQPSAHHPDRRPINLRSPSFYKKIIAGLQAARWRGSNLRQTDSCRFQGEFAIPCAINSQVTYNTPLPGRHFSQDEAHKDLNQLKSSTCRDNRMVVAFLG